MFIPVQISKRAIQEIKQILEKKNIPDEYSLRLGVKGGAGCFGINYVLGFDKEREGDEQYKIDGVRVLIEKKQMMYLAGKRVSFYEGADAKGFVFEDEEDSKLD